MGAHAATLPLTNNTSRLNLSQEFPVPSDFSKASHVASGCQGGARHSSSVSMVLSAEGAASVIVGGKTAFDM